MTPRVFAVLVRERPPLPGLDERAWASIIARAELPLHAQLAVFALQRAELTGVLRRLSDHQWQRTGIHETLGEGSVLAICERIAAHEEEHLAQIRSIIGRVPREGEG